ncbi:hypothetical protein [Opitutus sp. GAS368]|uniref:hypothetical protein n=1 Tax=Opitutus sp. GAS368 TaxID=1882749 RepID=UPI0012FE394B|nr:hypothetical protein [Opitutus sp. GAS368]
MIGKPVQRLGRTALTPGSFPPAAMICSARSPGDRVKIAGHAVLYLRGAIEV